MEKLAPNLNVASLAVVFSSAIWGLLWVPLHAFESAGLHGAWTMALLNLPAAALILPIFLFRLSKQAPYLRQAVPIGLTAGLGLALYSVGLMQTSVIRAILLFYLTPIWSTLIGLFLLGEDVRWQRWAAIGLGLVGVALLVAGNKGEPLNQGDLIALLSGMVWAVAASLISRAGPIPLAGMTMVQFLATASFTVLISFSFGPVPMPGAEAIAEVAPFVIAASLCLFLPSVFLIFWAQQSLYPGRVGILMMSEVLVAVISASLFLPEEQMSLVQWAGAVLIVGAGFVELVPIRQRKRI